MGLKAGLLGLLVAAGSGIPGGSAVAANRSMGCRVPAGAQLVAQDSFARIVAFDQHRQTADGTNINREWRYCWRKTGGYHTLVIDGSYAYGYGDIVAVYSVALAGPWAAWITTTICSGGRYDCVPEGAMSVRDLGGGQVSVAPVGGSATCGAEGLVLTPAGTAASLIERCSYSPVTFSWAVQAINGRDGNSATLDSAPPSQSTSDPFANLQLYECEAGCTPRNRTVAWWLRDGAWRSAPTP